MTDLVWLREEPRRVRFAHLARPAFALNGQGVSCTLRLPGRRGEHAVLEMPGGTGGLVRVEMRKETAGWRYTMGAHTMGAHTLGGRTVDAHTVWAADADLVSRILRAVSR
ncbi:hypothetical protein GCM10009555_074830 [Acrocarpospora macrocephala]|uniref:Uncharacterized protein n=1 Tax=Acrocarpospora macrocephala TaxID=150177 RepID=A0A5M3WZ81_9ACTN|nr:hypothetical protein [Acrocarpospora macrocephala]GES11358.1 hypothetical protein Amac_049550 [Acrocarpospora macrocephala]